MSLIRKNTFSLEKPHPNNKIILNLPQLSSKTSRIYPWNLELQLEKELELNFHTNQVNEIFKPLRVTLSFIGRWPFHPETRLMLKPKNNNSNIIREYIQVYNSSLKSPLWIYFILTTIFLNVTLVLYIIGFLDFLLDWNIIPKTKWDKVQKESIQTNIVPLVLNWSCLLHSSLSSISFFLDRKKIVKYLNYWNIALDQLGIEIPKSIKRYVWTSQIGYGFFITTIAILGHFLYWNIIRGCGLLTGIMIIRPYPNLRIFDEEGGTDNLEGLYLFGLCIIWYTLFSSRVFLMIFRFHVKLLKVCFLEWNKRFQMYLQMSSPEKALDDRFICEKLKEDCKILLKLVRLTNEIFGPVLQTYYFCQLINMCFELYYLARSGSSENVDRKDFIGAIAILLQNVYVFFALSLDAATMSEEAMKGLEILRSNWITPDDTIYRKYLVSHMQTVYSQNIVITGSKYFSLDRPFIITMLGSVFTYFIIILQVGPSLHDQLVTPTVKP